MLILLHDTHCAGDLATAADSASTADDDEGAGTDNGIVGPKLEAFLSMMKSPSTTQLGLILLLPRAGILFLRLCPA